jgi:hypothetical protein
LDVENLAADTFLERYPAQSLKDEALSAIGANPPVITANTTVAPDGQTTASSIAFGTGVVNVCDDGGGNGSCAQQDYNIGAPTPANRRFTSTVWLRAAAPTTVQLRISSQTANGTPVTVTLGSAWKGFTITQGFAADASTHVYVHVMNPGAAQTVYFWQSNIARYAVVDATNIFTANQVIRTPGANLTIDATDVSGNAEIDLCTHDGGGVDGCRLQIFATATASTIRTHNSSPLILQTNDTTALTINTAQQVIVSDLLTDQLTVNGLLVITSGQVLQNVTANTNILTTGQLPLVRGGLGVDASSISQGWVFAAPAASSGAPAFRALVAGDIPDLSATYLTTAGGAAGTIPVAAPGGGSCTIIFGAGGVRTGGTC